jgi:GNAT superfamily N-acetyltransferase
VNAIVREATRADVPAMQRIRHAVRENRLTSRTITDNEVLHAMTATGRGWVAEVDGQVVGFAIGDAETGNIWALFVEPSHERFGHGRRLHDEMLRWLWSLGLERLWLTTERGTRAEAFYRRAGWLQAGITPSSEVLFEQFVQGQGSIGRSNSKART